MLVGSGLGLKIFAHVCLLCSSKSSLPRVESSKNYFSLPNSNPKAAPKATPKAGSCPDPSLIVAATIKEINITVVNDVGNKIYSQQKH